MGPTLGKARRSFLIKEKFPWIENKEHMKIFQLIALAINIRCNKIFVIIINHNIMQSPIFNKCSVHLIIQE